MPLMLGTRQPDHSTSALESGPAIAWASHSAVWAVQSQSPGRPRLSGLPVARPSLSSQASTITHASLGFIAVCLSCDELINSIGLSGLHPTLQVPARPEPEGPQRDYSFIPYTALAYTTPVSAQIA